MRINLFEYNQIPLFKSKIKKTNLGVSYAGSKRAISCEILHFIESRYPETRIIYDLFGGCGGFAFNALANGYEVFYNELAEYPFNIVKFILENDLIPSEALRFCSREEFNAIKAKEKKTPIDYIKLFAYSFRCNGKNYFCNPEKELFKRQGHNMVVFQSKEAVDFWNDYFKTNNLFNEFLTFKDFSIEKRRKFYGNAMLKIEALSVTNLLQKFQKDRNAYTISDFFNIKTKEVCAYVEKNIPKDTPLKSYKTKRYETHLNDMRKLDRLQQLQQLQQLDLLQQLQQLQQLEQKSSIKLFNFDYRKVKLPQPQDNRILIYCDIPYKGLTCDYHIDFNHEEFYEWALKMARQGYGLLISEYEMPLKDFECVYFIEKLNPQSKNKTCEKLFIPKKNKKARLKNV